MATTAETSTAETMTLTTPTSATPIVSLTPEAHRVVRQARDEQSGPVSLALWLEVRGVQDGSFVYDLFFQAASDAGEEDEVHVDGDVQVVVPAGSVERLRGARLEWSDEGEGGLVLVNPNTPTLEERSPGVPPELLAAGVTSPLAQRVIGVLEQLVNPSIASHGGRADLLALDSDAGIAYLRLSGGCQGCAMSQMTLKQGIETTLLEEVTELTRVVDVTDHGGGENPYY